MSTLGTSGNDVGMHVASVFFSDTVSLNALRSTTIAIILAKLCAVGEAMQASSPCSMTHNARRAFFLLSGSHRTPGFLQVYQARQYFLVCTEVLQDDSQHGSEEDIEG